MVSTADTFSRLRDAEQVASIIADDIGVVASRLAFAMGETPAVMTLRDLATEAEALVKTLGEIRDEDFRRWRDESDASIARSLRMGFAIALADDPKAAAVLVAKVEGYPLPDEAQETTP